MSAPVPFSLRAASGFGLAELSFASGLRAQFLPTGVPFALRHGSTLLNQYLPGPAESGLFRLFVRQLDATGHPLACAPLVGPGLEFFPSAHSAVWRSTPFPGVTALVTFSLHPVQSAWAWCVELHNATAAPLTLDVLHVQDLGLADEAAVRNNEAYVSQYLDLLPVANATFGPAILARQNQPMLGGRHPWAAFACVTGATAYATDGSQVFGADYRLTAAPAIVREPALPSRRLQYEFSVAALQSRQTTLAPATTSTITFVALFAPDHPAASAPADLALLRALLPLDWPLAPALPASASADVATSLFHSTPTLAGAQPTATELAAWFPGTHRHLETADDGAIHSFFCNRATHVVTRAKEALVARPHGHVLRSGDSRWPDPGHFGLTCYAAGIFGAQSYLGNPNLARLLGVVRNYLHVPRAAGQRAFIRLAGAWRQLGVPSAFALEPGRVRWFYRLSDRLLTATLWCAADHAAAYLHWEVLAGPATAFLFTHQLALGANEFDQPAALTPHADAWLAATPDPASFTAQHLPGTCFALGLLDPAHLAAAGGDELLYSDATRRHGPYAVLQTRAVTTCAVFQLGATTGPAALPATVTAVRRAYNAAPATPPDAPLHLSAGRDPGIARVDAILPWFTHNASIHFAAPHGLEQYGGAAWGVRDVTQGSLEWLLTAGDYAPARRALAAVFAQQYSPAATDSSIAACWPQWFMFAPFRFIQQAHSHGDVCFWPVKALCDYVEATNDLAFLDEPLAYTDPVNFTATGPSETLWQHCDRVITHVENRFLPGTALVNYGDGDWDDTLQPADPAMRTRMISAWTVALAYHTLRQYAELSRRARHAARAAHLDQLLARIRADFARYALPDGTVAGFLIHESDGSFRALLHPTDRVTGIRHRLLPMTRAILAELFTPAEARHHAALIERELRFTDGVRLMSEPATYHGGLEKLFKRADTAANVGREIGLQYVHAHLRYAEAMAKLGDADRLWWALQVVNPVDLAATVPTAAPRQANVYFSSSDADFADRLEAADRWPELRAGRVCVRGGWRLYSSGPGLYLHKVRACLLGLRESFDAVIFDPILPRSLDGLVAHTHLLGRPLRLTFHFAATPSLTLNATPLPTDRREPNPYRLGGFLVLRAVITPLLRADDNHLAIALP